MSCALLNKKITTCQSTAHVRRESVARSCCQALVNLVHFPLGPALTHICSSPTNLHGQGCTTCPTACSHIRVHGVARFSRDSMTTTFLTMHPNHRRREAPQVDVLVGSAGWERPRHSVCLHFTCILACLLARFLSATCAPPREQNSMWRTSGGKAIATQCPKLQVLSISCATQERARFNDVSAAGIKRRLSPTSSMIMP